MPLYFSSFVYIFAVLEISLPHPGVVSIYGGGIIWGCRVMYSEGLISISLDSGGVVVWMLNDCCS